MKVGLNWYRPFQLNEIQVNRWWVDIPLPFEQWQTAGVSGYQLRHELYRETMITVSNTVRLRPSLRLMLALQGYQVWIARYGEARTYGLTFGWQAQLLQNLSWTTTLINPNKPRLGVSREPLPQIVASRLILQPLPSTSVIVSLLQDLDYEASLFIGVRYQPWPWLRLAMGHADHPQIYSGQIYLTIKSIEISLAVQSYVQLHRLTIQTGVGLSIPEHRLPWGAD